MEWIKEQDRKLGRLRFRITFPAVKFVCRVLVGIGATAEVLLCAFTDDDIVKDMKESNFGIVGYLFEHKRRREYNEMIRKKVHKLLDEELGDTWVNDVVEDRMRLDL